VGVEMSHAEIAKRKMFEKVRDLVNPAFAAL
jgi:hypothetical protein